MVGVTTELLIEGMRADAPLEAGLVECSLQLGGGFGGGEVEDRAGGGGDGDAVSSGDVARGHDAVGGEHGRHRERVWALKGPTR